MTVNRCTTGAGDAFVASAAARPGWQPIHGSYAIVGRYKRTVTKPPEAVHPRRPELIGIRLVQPG
jgi:hypothetical protein